MNRALGMKLAVALLSIGGAAAAATMATADDDPNKTPRKMQVIVDDGSGDRLEIEDLADLEVGASRSYQTESGRPVTVTRDEEGYAVEVDRDSKSGDTKTFVFAAGPEADVVFLRGREGEHGFAFSTAGDAGRAPHELLTEALLARLDKSEKFRSLDDATQEVVREAIRESAPEAHWIGLAGPGHEGKEGAVRVIVREHQSGEKKER